jgi:hypothetical protein
VTAESVAEAPNVVIGTFMVNTYPATVLFDTGAMHSFITRSFVEHHGIHTSTLKRGTVVYVAEPLELFRLKYVINRRTTAISSTHFKRNNSLVCRVSARYNHGSAGSKQVYLARRRVYITE